LLVSVKDHIDETLEHVVTRGHHERRLYLAFVLVVVLALAIWLMFVHYL
jgi:hypothetical protein